MPRYIDADKVEKWSWQEPRYSDSINDRTDLRDFLRSLPAISTDEVRGVGEWTRIDYHPCGHDYKCSECGDLNDRASRYCPSCGARMKGADDEL